jgi:hypothetical protein
MGRHLARKNTVEEVGPVSFEAAQRGCRGVARGALKNVYVADADRQNRSLTRLIRTKLWHEIASRTSPQGSTYNRPLKAEAAIEGQPVWDDAQFDVSRFDGEVGSVTIRWKHRQGHSRKRKAGCRVSSLPVKV